MERRTRRALLVVMLACPAALLMAACDSLPTDIEGTSERVRAERSYRVGIDPGVRDEPRIEALLGAVSEDSGSQAAVEPGATEPMLKRLERGALDIVIAPMTAKSPWSTKVHFLPLESGDPQPPDELQLVAMARNGENAWIALLHRHASAVAGR